MILSWDKPEKIMTTAEWKAISADGAPAGVYVPNMSDADADKWKAKLVGVRSDHLQVEIRKTTKGNQLVIIVGLDGYNYGNYRREPAMFQTSTLGTNVHMAVNGPARMTFDEVEQLYFAIAEARQVLGFLQAGLNPNEAKQRAAKTANPPI